MNEQKKRIYELAELMEMMKESPIYEVKRYFRNRGYTNEEIKQALNLLH